MKMIEIEKITARKFIEIKGSDYLDSSKYTMSKCVTELVESNEIKFEFLISKARPKNSSEIIVDETVSWDEVISICVNKETGKCRVT